MAPYHNVKLLVRLFFEQADLPHNHGSNNRMIEWSVSVQLDENGANSHGSLSFTLRVLVLHCTYTHRIVIYPTSITVVLHCCTYTHTYTHLTLIPSNMYSKREWGLNKPMP